MYATIVTTPKAKEHSVTLRNNEEHDKIANKYHLPKSLVCVIIKILETGTGVNKFGRGCEQIF